MDKTSTAIKPNPLFTPSRKSPSEFWKSPGFSTSTMTEVNKPTILMLGSAKTADEHAASAGMPKWSYRVISEVKDVLGCRGYSKALILHDYSSVPEHGTIRIMLNKLGIKQTFVSDLYHRQHHDRR